jgi:hypothetical protein
MYGKRMQLHSMIQMNGVTWASDAIQCRREVVRGDQRDARRKSNGEKVSRGLKLCASPRAYVIIICQTFTPQHSSRRTARTIARTNIKVRRRLEHAGECHCSLDFRHTTRQHVLLLNADDDPSFLLS